MHNQTCLICGFDGPRVRVRLVEWKDPTSDRYAAIPTCADVEDCRGRVFENGETWPITEPEEVPA